MKISSAEVQKHDKTLVLRRYILQIKTQKKPALNEKVFVNQPNTFIFLKNIHAIRKQHPFFKF